MQTSQIKVCLLFKQGKQYIVYEVNYSRGTTQLAKKTQFKMILTLDCFCPKLAQLHSKFDLIGDY